MKKGVGIVVMAVVVIGLWTLFSVLPRQTGDEKPLLSGSVDGAPRSPRMISTPEGHKPASARVNPMRTTGQTEADEDDADEEDGRTPAERKLAADIEKALDEEDFELAKKCAPLAMVSKDVEIRRSMVDTLGWFGEKALPELTPFIADSDEDVAENAMNEWESAVSSIEDEPRKIETVEMAMQAVTDEDALESMSNEYIGVDEKLAVQSLLRIIEANVRPEGAAKARETYEFITGEAFTDRAAVEKWIAEEYQPSE